MSGKWYLLDIKQAEEKFNTSSAAGLSRKAAGKLLADMARNKSQKTDKSPLSDITKTIFADSSMVILFGLCLISAFTGHGGTFAFILVVTLPYLTFIAIVNILISLSGRKAEKVLTPFSKVKRDGKLYQVKSTGVVPGDLLFLTSGDYIPADALIVSADNLRVSFESSGGSVLMSKSAENLSQTNDNLPLFKRSNILCAGSYVVSGSGYAIAAATGNESYSALSGGEVVETDTAKNAGTVKKARTGITRTAFILNLIALGFILIYTLLSLFFPFSGIRMYDAFLAAAALAALVSNGLVTMCSRAALLSVMLYEDCSYSRGIVLNNPESASKFADIRTLFVNDRMFVSDGRLTASVAYAGGRECWAENEAAVLSEEYLRNIAMSVFSEPADSETGFARDIRYAAALRNFIIKSGKKEEDITYGCNLIGYVRRGAASRFDTVVFSFGGRTYRVCRTLDESLISASAYTVVSGGIIPLTPDMSEKLHALYHRLRMNGNTIITTASVVGSSLVLDGMLTLAVNSHSGEVAGSFIKSFTNSGIRVIFTSTEADGDVTWYNNPMSGGANVMICDIQSRAADIIRNTNLVYLNSVSPALLSELIREAGKSGATALANCSPFFSEASGRASVKIYCTQFDTGAKIRNDLNIPISSIDEENQRSSRLLADSDVIVSQPHNRRGGLSQLEKVFRLISGRKQDESVYGRYLVNSFVTRLVLMLIFAFTGEFVTAPLVIAAGVMTDALALAILISFDNTAKITLSGNDPEGKSVLLKPLISAVISAVISFIVSRLFVIDDSNGTAFLFISLISSSAALLFCQISKRIIVSPDSDRFITALAGCAAILLALIIMVAVKPVATALCIETTVPGFIAAAGAVPVAVIVSQRISDWFIKLDGGKR